LYAKNSCESIAQSYHPILKIVYLAKQEEEKQQRLNAVLDFQSMTRWSIIVYVDRRFVCRRLNLGLATANMGHKADIVSATTLDRYT
jgi:hypothetical protein